MLSEEGSVKCNYQDNIYFDNKEEKIKVIKKDAQSIICNFRIFTSSQKQQQQLTPLNRIFGLVEFYSNKII